MQILTCPDCGLTVQTRFEGLPLRCSCQYEHATETCGSDERGHDHPGVIYSETEGVGTELHRIIHRDLPELVIKLLTSRGCRCHGYLTMYNLCGVEWCIENKATIVSQIAGVAKMLPGFNRVVATHWVDEAIECARQ